MLIPSDVKELLAQMLALEDRPSIEDVLGHKVFDAVREMAEMP